MARELLPDIECFNWPSIEIMALLAYRQAKGIETPSDSFNDYPSGYLMALQGLISSNVVKVENCRLLLVNS